MYIPTILGPVGGAGCLSIFTVVVLRGFVERHSGEISMGLLARRLLGLLQLAANHGNHWRERNQAYIYSKVDNTLT